MFSSPLLPSTYLVVAEGGRCWSKRHRAGIPLQARGGLGGGEKGGSSASDSPESPTQGHLIFPVA